MPEKAFHDFTIPEAMGYAESKYVAERLLEGAKASYGVSSAICRVGQLAGPVHKRGVWSKQEWFPSVSISSRLFTLRGLANAMISARRKLLVPG